MAAMSRHVSHVSNSPARVGYRKNYDFLDGHMEEEEYDPYVLPGYFNDGDDDDIPEIRVSDANIIDVDEYTKPNAKDTEDIENVKINVSNAEVVGPLENYVYNKEISQKLLEEDKE